MRVPLLNTCGCGCSLKTGTKIIGWLQLIYSALTVIMLGGSLAGLYFIEEHPSKDTEKIIAELPVLKATAIASIILYIVGCGLALILLLGAYQNKAQFIFFWVVSIVTLSVLELLVTLIHLAVFREVSYLLTILDFFLNLYFALVVYSFYRSIENVSTNYS